MSVLTVPAFNDNYLWLIHDGASAAVVDPGDASAILAALDRHGLTLVAILLTHHHADHVGGVQELLARNKVPVFGPWKENIAGISDPLGEGDLARLPALGLDLQVLDVPGHTLGHIAYYSAKQHWLFCGDTLFAGGCGRIFEGTPAQMQASLAKLAALPGATAVYCAHEYTLANLKFAQEVEPGNPVLQARIVADTEKRRRDIPTVPSTIDLENATNPFLRAAEPAIRQRLASLGKLPADRSDALAAFTTLREWKNVYL